MNDFKSDMERGARGGAWGDIRVERAEGRADHVISTDYSRHGFGGHWDRRRRVAERRAAVRSAATPGIKAMRLGVAAALVVVVLLGV